MRYEYNITVENDDDSDISVGAHAGHVNIPGSQVVEVLMSPQGARGPQGPVGPAGGGLTIAAGPAIGGHRAVKVDSSGLVQYASNDDGEPWGCIGISSAAAISGADVSIVAVGVLDEGSWTWTPGDPIFVGANGVLTQTAPTSPAYIRIIATALTQTRVMVNAVQPIVL